MFYSTTTAYLLQFFLLSFREVFFQVIKPLFGLAFHLNALLVPAILVLLIHLQSAHKLYAARATASVEHR